MIKKVYEINLHSNMASLNFRCILIEKPFCIVYTWQLKKILFEFYSKTKDESFIFLSCANELALEIITY